MPDSHSKESRALANVRLQIRSGSTRGVNPRKLSDDEIQVLKQKASRLQQEMAEARHQRSVARINGHTTQEAEQTRAAVRDEGQQTRQALQPLTALVVGEGDSVDDRIRTKRNAIALLRAGIREDLAAKKRAREQSRGACNGGSGKCPRVSHDYTPLDNRVEPDQPAEEDLPQPVVSEDEPAEEDLPQPVVSEDESAEDDLPQPVANEDEPAEEDLPQPVANEGGQVPPEEMQTLAVYAPAQAWALEREARNREYMLQCEAEEARRVAADKERARLAPEETRQFRETYERLAAQHAWPALPEGPALPRYLSDGLAWFFQVAPAFRAALYAKMRFAMQKEGYNAKCSGCQSTPRTDPSKPGSWDRACARHRVLSAIVETRLEVELEMQWAEQALMSAVAAQQRAVETAERQRLASLAREAEAREERKRHWAIAKQARKELNPRASKCQRCKDVDFAFGNLCVEHEEELQRIETRLREESPPLSLLTASEAS